MGLEKAEQEGEKHGQNRPRQVRFHILADYGSAPLESARHLQPQKSNRKTHGRVDRPARARGSGTVRF